MNNMIVSVNPHIYAKDTTQTIMREEQQPHSMHKFTLRALRVSGSLLL